MEAEELTADEQETLELALELRQTGNLHPLVARLRDGELGPERARDVLTVLADYDPSLLVQITLDSLIAEYLDDRGTAHQPRREGRDGDANADAP